MDEYTMSWSDAIRTEAAFLAIDAVPPPTDDVNQFGTLGTALWQERCLAHLLKQKAGLADAPEAEPAGELMA